MRRLGCLLVGCLGVIGIYVLETVVYFYLFDRIELTVPVRWALFGAFFLGCALWLRLVRVLFS